MNYEERRIAEITHGYIDDLREIAASLREHNRLLLRYGKFKFGDDWTPEDAADALDEAEAARLKAFTERT